ncbi:endonuclease [Flavobacterium aurantiibacter]|uniref:endonuclease n=1 Tax=Flavobacterium aurantiibacter TaxID=2023067 RepID=UPI0013FE4126|nr:endonuclease [Flavobacterium aurantiibacter]
MKKILLLATVSLYSVLMVAQAGAPAAPYYNGFNWNLTGDALKTALATKISTTHTNFLTYTPGVWNALKIIDQNPENSQQVLLMYGYENGTDNFEFNDRARNKNSNGGNTGEWNREHVFAQALGNPDLGSSGPGADAHMLRACDVSQNNARGNRKYSSGSGNAGTAGVNWYPGDEWKGDVARIILYMYLRYGEQCTPTFVGSGPTITSDPNVPIVFLQWNAEDPVSPFEDNRNTYLGNGNNTYGQGNRNPFIDNPVLATLIWGGPVAENRWPNLFLNTETRTLDAATSIYPNPAKADYVYVNASVDLETIEVINLNGQLVQRINKPTEVNDTYQIQNLNKGFYLVKLTANGETTTKKLVVN